MLYFNLVLLLSLFSRKEII